MANCECRHEKTIARLEKLIDGNGQGGLVKEVTKLRFQVTEVQADINKLATSYSALVKNQEEHDAVERVKQEAQIKRHKMIQRLSTIFGIIFGLIGILYLILDHV